MESLNFTEDDKSKVIEYLNMIAKYATFSLNTQELLQYYKLLSHMQTRVLPKLEANILEVKKVVDTNKE